MSELTKTTIKIAAILFKNLSDALLTTASEISKLEACQNTPETFTQTGNNPALSEPEKPKLITCYQYSPKQKVMVLYDGAQTPTRCKVVRQLDPDTYVICPQRLPKSAEREVRANQILGLDPNR